MRSYWVYIVTNRTRTLYVGVTNDLERRLFEHRSRSGKGFTSRYSIDRLLYAEETNDIGLAIEREKEIKAWRRGKKVALINKTNPKWSDIGIEPRPKKRNRSA